MNSFFNYLLVKTFSGHVSFSYFGFCSPFPSSFVPDGKTIHMRMHAGVVPRALECFLLQFRSQQFVTSLTSFISWVELALAELAETRGHDGHDGRGHRENLFNQLWCAFHIFWKTYPQNIFYNKKKLEAPAAYALVSSNKKIKHGEIRSKIPYK